MTVPDGLQDRGDPRGAIHLDARLGALGPCADQLAVGVLPRALRVHLPHEHHRVGVLCELPGHGDDGIGEILVAADEGERALVFLRDPVHVVGERVQEQPVEVVVVVVYRPQREIRGAADLSMGDALDATVDDDLQGRFHQRHAGRPRPGVLRLHGPHSDACPATPPGCHPVVPPTNYVISGRSARRGPASGWRPAQPWVPRGRALVWALSQGAPERLHRSRFQPGLQRRDTGLPHRDPVRRRGNRTHRRTRARARRSTRRRCGRPHRRPAPLARHPGSGAPVRSRPATGEASARTPRHGCGATEVTAHRSRPRDLRAMNPARGQASLRRRGARSRSKFSRKRRWSCPGAWNTRWLSPASM